ncbi:MAG TPA: UDP-N-acetylmuramoyl-L-alanyl-D-glutamate--2,6-diaminopimelate ligase [Candidatus Saccharimonadales bacterium]|nr:UDP-N-acetylmuramoyl-L-alanyl-D-glutamate--2,6-diaminopimelate ligase [Candidatus Saccharimonadales bacterium]
MSLRWAIKRLLPEGVFRAVAPWGHLAEAVFYNCMYGFPARGMKVVGVTGTNGKTTTSFLVHRMLSDAGLKTGLMTTVGWAAGPKVYPQTAHMTNVPVPMLMKHLRAMRRAGVEWLVLETTSHALVQHRTWGVPYSVGVFTNLTQDHLDYHRSMEEYAAAKQRLFKRVQRNKRGLQMGIANADDQYGASFASITENSVLYGVDAGEVRAIGIKMGTDGIAYQAKASDKTYHITSRLPGRFNVYNTLAAVCVGRAVGLGQAQVEQGIAALEGVPGRMQQLQAGQKFGVVIDYAHTPDALEKVLTALRETTKGRLLLVFGATGNRDVSKRPLMGEVAGRLADWVFLTDDETYTENGDAIRRAVHKGLLTAGAGEKTVEIADRREAIRAAFAEAKADDVVVLAGIGHQNYRMMGGKEVRWSEADVAREVLG